MSDAKRIVDLCEELGTMFDNVYLKDSTSAGTDIQLKIGGQVRPLRIDKPIDEQKVLKQAKAMMNVK